MKANFFKMSAAVITGLLGTASFSTAQGALLAGYSFTAGNLQATTTAAGVVAAPVTAGSNLTTAVIGPPSNAFYTTGAFMTATRTGTTPAAVYFEVTITAAAGQELDLTNFSIDMAKGGAADPRTYDIRSSVGGLTLASPSLGAGTLTYTRPASNGVMPTYDIDLSGSQYQHLSTLTMRLYINTPTVSQAVDVDNITFSGSVAAVPEPMMSGWFLLAGAFAQWRGNRRR